MSCPVLPILSVIGCMAQNTSISLGDHFADFISREVESGKYGSVSVVVRAGLCLLEDQERHLATLRSTLIAGESSGAPGMFDFEALIASKMS